MTGVILCDLDSTVADNRHRSHLAAMKSKKSADWIAYSKACGEDTPIQGVVAALQLYKSLGMEIFFVSGRNEEARPETVQWLMENSIPFDKLRLRREGDILNNGAYKVAYIEQLREDGYQPLLMFEDHVKVSKMVEAAGVPVVTVNPRYVDTVGVNFNNVTEADFDKIDAR